MSDERIKIVSIMNYPPDPNTQRMCWIFLDSVIDHGAKSITLLYEDFPPIVTSEHRRAADIELVQRKSLDVGHPHFNLRFKLANLAKLDFPFLFLDADMVVLSDLNYLWQRRNDKPWMGINHQWVSSDPGTHRPPFLNSGLQLVSDPKFYDLNAILAAQNAVAPLHRAAEFGKFEMFASPGTDQALLYRYFRSLNYDYTHPEIGLGWNSCAGVTDLWQEEGLWKAKTRGYHPDYEVQIVHFWAQFKPWKIECPLFRDYRSQL
ncbi:hypothetical protein KIH39_05760 [Telmatocola sphagniphila]|uniref:Uncharacterized protein n=1 Tax=Telmatocola sphagniphila TaxID=1123043 RepID=A0A8E6B7Q5_9BACT|nr:hypothetical protein [Telmatocola sphagniphila]QVL33418.1 hypothetical protein KIH39_05760 [Telmatocola sphagniphila]